MAHTPGPWSVKGTEIWAARKRITMGRGAYDEKDRAIRDANAQLIAAAPDLLAALELYVDADGYEDGIKAQAREAIAKARGA